jgi:hypothetical protein
VMSHDMILTEPPLDPKKSGGVFRFRPVFSRGFNGVFA